VTNVASREPRRQKLGLLLGTVIVNFPFLKVTFETTVESLRQAEHRRVLLNSLYIRRWLLNTLGLNNYIPNTTSLCFVDSAFSFVLHVPVLISGRSHDDRFSFVGLH